MGPPIATVNDTRPVSERGNPLPVPADTNVVPYQDYFYRLTAILPGGGESPASAVMSARPFDGSPPPEPTWERSEWVKLDAGGGEHPFTDTDPTLTPAIAVRVSFASTTVARVVVQSLSGSSFEPVSTWLNPAPASGAGTTKFQTYLHTLDAEDNQTLRSRAVTLGGRDGLSSTREIAAP